MVTIIIVMRLKLLTIAVLMVAIRASAQVVPQVDEPTARQHLVKQDAPIYPAIAKAAQVTGSVVLQVQVTSNGTVSSTKIISGPPMLNPAAIDAVKRWTFKPFEIEGRRTSVTTTITIPFGLSSKTDPNDATIAALYFPAFQKCLSLAGPQSDTVAPVKACREAADIASRFSAGTRFNERRTAYIYTANALLKNHEPQESLVYADKAVDIILQGQGDESAASGAFSQRALARASLGDLAGADKDLTTAEDYQRKGIDSQFGRENPRQYVGTLKNILSLHAQILDAMGKSDEALAKRNELAKL
jgi:TonB family protein